MALLPAARRRGGRVLDAEAGSPGDPQAPAGASRRDRKAAAHRRRRRRTLYMAVGFVLAAGGLSLAELGVDAPGLGPSPAAAESPDGSASPAASSLPKKALQVPLGRPHAQLLRVGLRIRLRLRLRGSRRDEREERRGFRIPDPRHPPGSLRLGPGDRLRGLGRVGPAGTDPTASAPTPAPSSSDDCNRFLWWCS